MIDPDTRLIAELSIEEARFKFPYDDATGKILKPGDTIKGFITIAIGVNLSAGLDDEEIDWLTRRRITRTRVWLSNYSWYTSQDPVRQNSLTDLGYNLGQGGLLHWPTFLHYMSIANYSLAAAEVRSNRVWVAEVGPTRSERLARMVETGQWPADIPGG